MSLFRYQGSKVYTMDFLFHGQRIRESSGTRSKTLAGKIEDKRRRGLEEGAAGLKKSQAPRLLSTAAQDWQELKKRKWSPGMATICKNCLSHLLPVLGNRLLI